MKISEETVVRIRTLWEDRESTPVTQADISRITGVSRVMVSRIIRNKARTSKRTFATDKFIQVGEGIFEANATIKMQELLYGEIETVTKKLYAIETLTSTSNDLVKEGLCLLQEKEKKRRARLQAATEMISQKIPKNVAVSYNNQKRGAHAYLVASWSESGSVRKISLGPLGFLLNE